MTKYDSEEERKAFLNWLEDMEYEKLELPRPDVVILLDMPLQQSEELVRKRAEAGGSMDIHEQHIEYLRRCHDAYQMLAVRYGWTRISCVKDNVLLTPGIIAESVKANVESFLDKNVCQFI